MFNDAINIDKDVSRNTIHTTYRLVASSNITIFTKLAIFFSTNSELA